MPATDVTKLRRKHRWLLAGLGSAVLAGVLLSCGSGCDPETKAAKPKEDNSLAVTVTSPKERSLRRSIDQPGIVKSYEETPIFPKLAGYLEDIKVDIGDRVKQGDLICRIWVPEIEEAVQVKKAKVLEGEKAVKKAKEDLRVAEENINVWESKVKQSVALVDVKKADESRWNKEFVRETKLGGDPNVIDKKAVEETTAQHAASKAALAEAKAAEEFARASLVESKARCEKARSDVKVAESDLEVWKNEYKEQLAWFSYARIEAPFDGKITRRISHTGHFVQPTNSGTTSKASEPLFVVMRTDLMRVVVEVPQYDAPLVKDGEEAVVRLQAFPGEEFKCKVSRSSWALNKESRTLRVELFLRNPEESRAQKPGAAPASPESPLLKWVSTVENPRVTKLEPGMYANVSIIAEAPKALTLPSETVLTNGNNDYVFVLENGKATKVNIKKGISNAKLTEVMAKEIPPQKPGDESKWVNFTGQEQIITSNLKSLQDGQAVRVKQ